MSAQTIDLTISISNSFFFYFDLHTSLANSISIVFFCDSLSKTLLKKGYVYLYHARHYIYNLQTSIIGKEKKAR
jgi:hypothetical protein